VRSRTLARVAAVTVGALLPMLVAAGPALASVKPDDGEVPGSSLGLGMTILLFVVVPIGAFLLIAGLALLPSALNKPRYRPGKSWDHEPVWIGGPAADPQQAISATGYQPTAQGGASAEW
jgi:hypothetical protein